MKKIVVLLLVLGVLFGLVGCGADALEPEITTTTVTTTEETTTTTTTITVDESLPYEIVLYRSYLTNEEPFVVRETILSRTDGTAEHIVALLVEHSVLPPGSRALSFDGTTLDMNESFLQWMVGSQQGLIITSLVRTFLTFFDLEYIYLTANGRFISTGHNTYDWPLCYNWYYGPN